MMFSSTVIYLELFVALFFLPGFFITVILGIKKFRFLLSFALSYALLVFTLLPFEYYAQPIVRWQWCALSEWVILAVLAAAKILIINPKGLSNVICGLLNPRLLLSRLIVLLVLTGMICGYLAYTGPYLEIPSDVWTHVFRLQWQKINVIDYGFFLPGSSFKRLFLMQHPYWHIIIPCYFIYAWLCHVSGLSIMDSLHILTFVNVTVFLLGFYYFGLYLFASLRISALKKMMMAAFVSLFAGATLGNNVFAYIRYYAFAPTILNYVLFLAAMAVIIAWMRSSRWRGHALWITPVLLIVTNAIHTQEALFIFFMTLAASLWESAKILWRKFIYRNFKACPALAEVVAGVVDPGPASTRPATVLSCRRPDLFSMAGQSGRGNRWTVREWKTLILAAFLLLVFFAGFAAIRYFKPGAWISNNMIMPHVSIYPGTASFIFNKLLISLPSNPWLRLVVYQLFIFYQVVGCWGLFVYLLFLLMIRHFVKIPFLMAGMVVVPFLTAFNPLTVDMIARLGQDPTIYRFHYLIPLPFVGGYLFVHFWDRAREWFRRMRKTPAESVSSVWPRLSWLNFAGSILVLAGLIGLIFPINAAGIYAPYSKIYTLRKIPAGNDYHLFDDLGKIMAKYENKVILTDGWTSGYLAFYSPKNTYTHVKWLNSANPDKELPEPYTWEKLRNRGLIVINRRNGDLSVTGKIARHWPEDVLPKVSRDYSIQMQAYLESHPEMFRKIWSQNRIAVYAVR